MRKLSKMLNQVGDRPGTLGFVSQKDVEKLEVATFLSIENKTDLQSLTVKDVSAILITDNSILESYNPPPSLVIGLDLREQNEISNKSQYEEIDFVLVRLSSNWQALDSEDCGLVLELDLSEETNDITELIQLLQGKQALPLDAILLSGGLSEHLGTIKNQLNLRRFNEAMGLPLIIAESSADSDPDRLRALGIKGLMA
jgi:hypothetical protein|tara:strand:- start:410 stop:1006 length:597 start_codon:yes stop_codon:yes gene_type:complete